MHKYLAILICALGLTACQKVINVDIKANNTQLVIEGNVNNIAGQQVISITRTIDYAQTNVYPPVSGATVTVANSVATYTFRETSPGQYVNSTIRARQNQDNTLKIVLDGKTYTAQSTVPVQVALDSLGVNLVTIGTREVKTVSVYYRDAVDFVNQYRFIMYVNGTQVKQIFTADDNNSNGKTINSLLYQTDITLKTGDKIDVEMQCVDAGVYNYWYSLSRQGGNTPNSPATPSNPITNIKGGALGYFSAHTIQRKSIVIL
ncbi:DUF4249 family protein [Mucilaginibacter myungsuensis]|uniref:DUF4249 domain-containing protein n=1 Tax=Mucilaginibacter myungsuensis TaxID=649104 RepID=A0A929KT65_9SPHI|nr:DUF4249 family protein [Mucilaginibacter myungsuensis]MBE9660717.1 DUF4249 domain-containing protein [Mucilaginibacter myungsuensis]MDN3600762.1 DUF4249 family protein [Mucilaginibacter myungsuensis]